MLGNHYPHRKISGQSRKDRLDSPGSSSGCAYPQNQRQILPAAPGNPPNFNRRYRLARLPTDHSFGGSNHLVQKLGFHVPKHIRWPAGWLGDKVHRPQLQCLQGLLCTLFGQRTYDDNGAWVFSHDKLQTLQPVHPGHLQVQGHHIRVQRLNLIQPILAVHGGTDNLNPGISLEHFRDNLPHKRRIIHD